MTHNSFLYVCLLQFSTCFEQPSVYHQESQLYQYDLWYMSFYVCDRVVCRFGWKPAYTGCSIDTIDSPDDEHLVAGNM